MERWGWGWDEWGGGMEMATNANCLTCTCREKTETFPLLENLNVRSFDTAMKLKDRFVASHGRSLHCKFCEYASRHTDRKLVFSDDLCVAMESKNPRADVHLLILPIKHYGCINSLTTIDVPLLRRMSEVGLTLLRERGVPVRCIGFHRPPFHSVEHLHMHCIGGSYHPWLQAVRYWNGSPWFVSVGSLIQELEGY
eukprot:753101-Hanusia_phi.AAC.4